MFSKLLLIGASLGALFAAYARSSNVEYVDEEQCWCLAGAEISNSCPPDVPAITIDIVYTGGSQSTLCDCENAGQECDDCLAEITVTFTGGVSAKVEVDGSGNCQTSDSGDVTTAQGGDTTTHATVYSPNCSSFACAIEVEAVCSPCAAL